MELPQFLFQCAHAALLILGVQQITKTHDSDGLAFGSHRWDNISDQQKKKKKRKRLGLKTNFKEAATLAPM